MSAQDELVRMIEVDGPISVATFMSFCLTDPRYGYYTTREPFGVAGDFTTAPEISQMFGELVGLWAASVWLDSGAPEPFTIAELGPGRGTLMADALRAIAQALKVAPPRVHLVEVSPRLREQQGAALAQSGAEWHASPDELPDAPMIIIANEFVDALPIRQAVKTESGWHERLVGLNDTGDLAFGVAPHTLAGFAPPPHLADAATGSIVEWRDDGLISDLARRMAQYRGAALIVDYGHVRSACGDTLQATRKHAFDDVLAHPGEADLTAHVDFDALGAVAARAGAKVSGPLDQGEFLRRLGVEARAAKLQAAAPGQAMAIQTALDRLTGRGPGQMGALFKVMALAHPELKLPGFD